MTRQTVSPSLSKTWKIIFTIEIPLTFGAIAFWLLAPMQYLAQALGENAAANLHAQPLLVSYAGVVFSMVGWIYLRFLLEKQIHIRSFCLFQEALLLGDIWIVVSLLSHLPEAGPVYDNALLTIGLASFWGAVRLVYLVNQRWGKTH